MERPFKNPSIIPENWYQFNRFQVDDATRQSYVQYGIKKWVDWEKETKSLYQTYYQELMQGGSMAAALKISEYLEDVDKELAEAEQHLLFYSGIKYNINDIMLMQEEKYHKYKKKIKEITL
jgi:hypothetical protein